MQCPTTGTTPGSRVQVPGTGPGRQLGRGHTRTRPGGPASPPTPGLGAAKKYPREAAVPGPIVKRIARKTVPSRKGSGEGRAGQRPSTSWEGLVGCHPMTPYARRLTTRLETEWNRVQSAPWETSSCGDTDPGPPRPIPNGKRPEGSFSKECEDADGTGSSLVQGPVRMESASGPDLDPSEEEEAGDHQG